MNDEFIIEQLRRAGAYTTLDPRSIPERADRRLRLRRRVIPTLSIVVAMLVGGSAIWAGAPTGRDTNAPPQQQQPPPLLQGGSVYIGDSTEESNFSTAEVHGALVVRSSCVLLQPPDDAAVPVVWPSGTTVVNSGSKIRLPSGELVSVGDSVTGGGEFTSVADTGESRWPGVLGCVSNVGEIAVFNNGEPITVEPLP